MKIAVTGATGFIGKYLINRLLNYSDNYIVALVLKNDLVNVESKNRMQILLTDFSQDELTDIFKDVDQIVHLAATRMPRSNEYVRLEFFYKANIKLLEDILIAASKRNVFRVILSSTIAVYGNSNKSISYNETFPLKPLNNYGLSKIIGENILNQFTINSGIETVALRFSQIFGFGERTDLIMNNFLIKFLKGEDVVILNSGFQKRDYLYVLDAVKAIDCVLHKDKIQGIFNVGLGNVYSAYEIGLIIKQLLNSKSKIIIPPNKLPDSIEIKMDISKFLENTKWKPEWNIENGIKDMYDSMILN